MSDISSQPSAHGPHLRLMRYDSADFIPVADDREQELSAQLEERIASQLSQIRQRLATTGSSPYSASTSEPGSILDVLA